MNKTYYASIDIGSNAARLLIKSVDESGWTEKQQLVRVPLRLGFDVFAKGYISEQKTKRIVRLMKSFYHLMRIYDVKYYRACATSAMRDASNSEQIIKKVEESAKIKIELISGMEEARIIYGNHIELQKTEKSNCIYVDVGGGSTEVNLLREGELVYSMSYNIGTVRLLSGAVEPKTWSRLADDLVKASEGIEDITIIGSGGNINRLYKLSPSKNIKEQSFSVASLDALCTELAHYSPEQLSHLYKLKADRADVIVPAAKIFLCVAEAVRATKIHVPVLGLSDGIIDEMLSTKDPLQTL